eukprot:scaffold163244_cov25-Tisochrysis_lutea.AAC.1
MTAQHGREALIRRLAVEPCSGGMTLARRHRIAGSRFLAGTLCLVGRRPCRARLAQQPRTWVSHSKWKISKRKERGRLDEESRFSSTRQFFCLPVYRF